MLVTLSGIVTLLSAEQAANAPKPMRSVPSGMTISVREEHAANARVSISVTPAGISISVRFPHIRNAEFGITVRPADRVTSVSALQPKHKLPPMLVTLSGIASAVRAVQFPNA